MTPVMLEMPATLVGRRQVLSTLSAAGTLAGSLTLSACGFKLREAPTLAFTSLYVGAAEGSSFGNELKRSLTSLGALQLVNDAKLKQTAQVLLEVLQDQREKTVVGVNAAGRCASFSCAYASSSSWSRRKAKT